MNLLKFHPWKCKYSTRSSTKEHRKASRNCSLTRTLATRPEETNVFNWTIFLTAAMAAHPRAVESIRIGRDSMRTCTSIFIKDTFLMTAMGLAGRASIEGSLSFFYPAKCGIMQLKREWRVNSVFSRVLILFSKLGQIKIM